MKMRNIVRGTTALAFLMALPLSAAAQETIETRIGPLSFTQDFDNGYPTEATIEKLYEERDFQRAVQAYLWSVPLISMAQWRWSHENELGAENGEIVVIESYADRLGGLTYNVTTPYVLPFIDLADGPWVLEMPGPEGSVRGAAHDMWQIGITPITKPGRYLFVGPGQDLPEAEGFEVHQSPMSIPDQIVPTRRRDLGQFPGFGRCLGACAPHIADARQGTLAKGQSVAVSIVL